MTGTIYLIAESDEDIEIVQVLLRKHGFNVRVERGINKRHGGLPELRKHLERSILDARARLNPATDCIAVLRDEDRFTESRRDLYNEVDAICTAQGIKRAVAINHIEAWLLGDEGFCQWLGIKAQNADAINAKEKLESLVRKKTGQHFTANTRSKALNHLSGVTHSPSLRAALKLLEDAPCTRK